MANNKDIIIIFAHYHHVMITCSINDNNNRDKKHIIKYDPNSINKVVTKHS